MVSNKKGLSTIVATLLIILLTLVAVGIIWVVVRNVVQGGTEQVDIDAKCLQATVVAKQVVNDTDANAALVDYSVTVERQGTGEEIGGVRLVFMNASQTVSDVFDYSEPIDSLETITIPATDIAIAMANKVTVVSYFLDSAGNEQLCSSNQNSFTFDLGY